MNTTERSPKGNNNNEPGTDHRHGCSSTHHILLDRHGLPDTYALEIKMKPIKKIPDYGSCEKYVTIAYSILAALLVTLCIFMPGLWGGN